MNENVYMVIITLDRPDPKPGYSVQRGPSLSSADAKQRILDTYPGVIVLDVQPTIKGMDEQDQFTRRCQELNL